jgi:hypothetical protein
VIVTRTLAKRPSLLVLRERRRTLCAEMKLGGLFEQLLVAHWSYSQRALGRSVENGRKSLSGLSEWQNAYPWLAFLPVLKPCIWFDFMLFCQPWVRKEAPS